jgi:nudix-type nucleoside diphosphatase (YffH/AdpP family)
MEPKITARESVYTGWCRLDRVSLRMPNGETVERHIEDHGPAVAVLPYDPDRRVAILIKQPRAPVIASGSEPVFEVPAGMLETDDPEICARREAIEEAGLKVSDLTPVANIWTLIPISTERIQLYLATYTNTDRVSAGGGAHDENEAIEVFELPLEEVGRMVRAGEMTDAKTLILVQRLMIDRPDLFTIW